MRVLTFLADRFAWSPHVRTLADAGDAAPGEVTDALVAFLHVEAADVAPDTTDGVLKKLLKHLKWLANKRAIGTIVLHSFTHLGGDDAPAPEALAFLTRLAARLRDTGYRVEITPFGWFHAWSIDVRGESLAKVFKQL